MPTLLVAALLASPVTAVVRADRFSDTKVFAPGVRIDWTAAAVELDATVVFRKGPLELFACSPQTKEHESILVTRAKPVLVFQVMGLVGLQPGSPIAFNKKTKKWRPPNGERLRIRVRCRGDQSYVPVRTWVVDPKTKDSPAEIPWVFAGSRTLPNGRFMADFDGTVICLVDFESALITVGALHTSDNTSLWLEANTESIPPLGTDCTIRIESDHRRIVALFEADGQLTYQGKPTSIDSLAALQKVDASQAVIVLVCGQGVSKSQIDSLRSGLLAKGVDPSRISIRSQAIPSKK